MTKTGFGRYFKKIFHLVLATLITFCNIPSGMANAASPVAVDLTFDKVYTDVDSNNIPTGTKGVDFTTEQFFMDLADDPAFLLFSGSSLSSVKITANGTYDETYKFEMDYDDGVLEISLKNSGYQLMKHALYDIYIPQGTFKNTDGTKINQVVNYSFVTNTDEGTYKEDILAMVSPAHREVNVDKASGTITFEFIDDIVLESGVLDNIGNFIQISTVPYNASIPGYNITPYGTGSDSILNYNVSVQGNKLVLQAKNGVLKDFAKYTVSLKDHTLYLKDSPSMKIYNSSSDGSGYETITFETNKLVESTSPANNAEGVSLEPTIEFKFKYPVVIEDGTALSLQTEDDSGGYVPDMDYTLSTDGKSLKVTLRSTDGENFYPLRKSTLYTFTLGEGAVKLDDYDDQNGDPIVNEEIILHFITTGDSESPAVTAYSSNTSKSDDITGIDTTQLDSSGSIYIHFDRAIKQDEFTKDHTLTEAVELYEIPEADETDYDPQGNFFDKNISYRPFSVSEAVYEILPFSVPDSDGVTGLENPENLEKIPVEKVEIVSSTMLKITPGSSLYNLNKYKMLVDRDYIESQNGVNIEGNIEFTFWTKAAGTAVVPSWAGVSETGAQSIIENTGTPYKSYTVFGAPQYSSTKPIVLNISREIIVHAQDEVVQEYPKQITRITFDALKQITLTDVYQPDETKKLKSVALYELEYYFENGIKKTRLSLYPDKALENGKYYKLSIPAGVFESRSGHDLGAIEVNFTVAGDSTGARGVYTLEDYTFKAVDLKMDGEVEFKIIGYNFVEAVDRVVLTATTGSHAGESLTIGADSIFFEDVTTLRVKIEDEIADKLCTEEYAGTYTVTVFFSDAPDTGYPSPVSLSVLPKDKPEVIEKYPSSSSSSTWFDEFSLNPKTIDGTKRYFLRVTFRDPDGKLVFNSPAGLSTLRDSSTVYAQGSEATMIDRDFLTSILNMEEAKRQTYIDNYLFTKDTSEREAYLYIPVKLLRPQTTYSVSIMPEIVYFSDMDVQEGSNDTITWSFSTMASPVVRSVSVGSVSEDYDEDDPIILTGDLFYESSVEVYFNDVEAEKVVVGTDSDGNKYLKVYLPDGSDRLEPGTYDITVRNDSNHERISYGMLSVVKAGDYVPEEGARVKGKYRGEEIVSNVKVSEDTITIPSRYNDNSNIRLDLDELVGEEVLVRKLKMDGDYGHTVGTLETTSGWCNIAISGLTLDSSAEDDEIVLNLGRVEPVVKERLKTKLRGKTLKSEFIQVTGSNFKLDYVTLSIPVSNSNGKNLKVLRYDEETGNWSTLSCTVNLPDMRVEVAGSKPGIFVVVEE